MNRESLAAAGNENIVKEDWQDREFVDWYNKHLRFEKEQLDAYLALLDLGSEDSFVDFGCGNGQLLAACVDACRLKEAAVSGSDVSAIAIDVAGERLPAAKFTVADFPALDHRLDLVERA